MHFYAFMRLAIGALAASIFVAIALPAAAQGVDVTSDVNALINVAIAVIGGVIVYVIKVEAPKLTGAQLSANDLAIVQAFLAAQAHSFVNAHLLKPGATVTVTTKSTAGDAMLMALNGAMPEIVARLGLSKDALAALAQGEAAKALNLMPGAPPYAPAASA